MPSSPTSERRAQLIREMAQDLNRTRQSLQSDSEFADLTGSHLSVDEESSQAYNNPEGLPRLPDESKRSARFASRPSQDFLIDTSAIGRAFPEMTGSGSSIDSGSSISIEIGRGLRNGTRNLSDDGNMKENANVGGKYKVDLNKLSRKHHTSARPQLQDVSANVESMRSSPPPMKATQYGTSGSSRQSSLEDRRTALPKVTVQDAGDTTGSSGMSNNNKAARGTRFESNKSNALSIPRRFTSGKDLLQAVSNPITRNNKTQKVTKAPVDNPTVTSTNGGTVQSFMLPNMPNMSELVSGVFDDGTPVFSRKGNPRFSTNHQSLTGKHAAIASLPVPQEEEAIMLSLQLLQDKVAELEKNKAEAQVAIKELQRHNRDLEHEKKEWIRTSRKYDSGVGSSAGSDAGDEDVTGTRKEAIERNRLQATVRNLQNELDGANRRAAIAEASAENTAKERDNAVNQLGVAFITHEQLKVDNAALKLENKELALEVKKLRAAIELYISKTETERTEMSKGKASDGEVSGQETRSVDCQVLDVETPKRPATRRLVSRSDAVNDEGPALDIPKRRKRRVILEEYTLDTEFDAQDDNEERQEPSEHRSTRNISKNVSRSLSHKERPASRVHSTKPTRQQDRDLTQASHVSFLQEGDVTMLRKMLEREHLTKKGRLQPKNSAANFQHELTENLDITQLTNRSLRARGLSKKSSLKDLRSVLNAESEAAIESEGETQHSRHSRAPSQHRRRHSDITDATHHSQRIRMPAADDMTSAFIMPDITMNLRQRRASHAKSDLTRAISVAAPEILINGEPHEANNCTICTRMLGNCIHNSDGKQPEVQIPTPVPASDRIKDLALDGEDHTTRPSEPPAQALARTIKALEDEFAHLGMQVTELQNIYNDLDPSLQKRKRKSLGERLDTLRSNMDAKGDQIYALYDVLEGQKSNKSKEMTEEELNDTLASMLGEEANLNNLGMPSGIMFKRGQKTSTADVTPAKERPKPRKMSFGQDKARPKSSAGESKFPWDESYEDEDAASLPWEGFDDTIDLTTGSRRSNTSSRRRSIGL